MKKIKPRIKLGLILCTKCNKVAKYIQNEDEAEGKTGVIYCDECLSKLVYGWKTKSEHGFIQPEYTKLIGRFPHFNEDRFYDALNGITCMMDNDKNMIIYHCDILTAIKCATENRNMTIAEFD